MSTIRDISSSGEIQTPTPEKPLVSENNISAPVIPQLETQAIADIFNMEGKEVIKYSDKLELLLEYAKTQTTDHSLENLKWVIRGLEMKLGTSPLGEKLINRLTQYAYLCLEGKKIDKEKERFIKK